MKRFLSGLAFGLMICAAGWAEAGTVTLDISYTDNNGNLGGVSGSGVLQAINAGGGEYDVVSGYINAIVDINGTLTASHQTLVANSNAPNFAIPANYENANGDVTTYDDRVFIPANSPASPDQAQVTYAGGLQFQVAGKSHYDVYLSANNQGSFGGYYYFAGYVGPYGTLGDGSLSTLSITAAPVSTPEPATLISASLAVLCAGGVALNRKRKLASA